MPTQARLRWGILGVANINRRLIPAFAKAHDAELVAIASRSLDRAQTAAAAVGIPKALGSYQALLDDPAIDAVYIPLPNTLHGEWAIKAAGAGKHILCEKPLTPSAAEAIHVVEAARQNKVQLMEGFMWPHHPRTARLRQFLDDGAIGPVQRVMAAFTFQLSLDPANIRLQRNMAGGSLLDVGCYPVYAIRWAFGAEPVRAYAAARFLHDVDVELSGLLWLADGRVGSFDCGFTLPYRGWLEISGTQGRIFVPDIWAPAARATFVVHRGSREPEVVAIEGADQIVAMIDHFSQCVLRGEPVRPPAEEAIRTLRVLDALAQSAREGCAQPVNV